MLCTCTVKNIRSVAVLQKNTSKKLEENAASTSRQGQPEENGGNSSGEMKNYEQMVLPV